MRYSYAYKTSDGERHEATMVVCNQPLGSGRGRPCRRPVNIVRANRHDFVLWRQQGANQLLQIQPPHRGIAQKSVLQIETVNVNDCFHVATQRTLEPGLLPAPLRIAVAQRMINNPSWGSSVFYQIIGMVDKWQLRLAECRLSMTPKTHTYCNMCAHKDR